MVFLVKLVTCKDYFNKYIYMCDSMNSTFISIPVKFNHFSPRISEQVHEVLTLISNRTLYLDF